VAIDIGALAIDRSSWSTIADRTYVSKTNPANANGTIDTVKIWASLELANCIVGTFFTTNGDTLKCRDSVAIGNVVAGSEQTFGGLSIAVEVGDYIGLYATAGRIERDSTGGDGAWFADGQNIDPNDETTYTLLADYAISLYGIGEEAEGQMSEVTDWKFPGTAANVDRDGKNSWQNPDNAKASDDAWADCDVDKEDYSDWLRLTNFGFTSEDIPEGATIDGIEMKMERSAEKPVDEVFINDSALYLRKTAGQIGDNKASASIWRDHTLTPPDEEVTYGGATDTWNAELADTDIVSEDFGIDISAYNTRDSTSCHAYVDCVSIRIHYTVAGIDHEKALSDTVTIADTIMKSVGQPHSDSLGIADAISKGVGQPQADSVGVADAVSKAVGQAQSDSVAIADSPSLVSTFERAFSDTETIADAISKGVGQPHSDSIAIADAISKEVGLNKADSIALADTFARAVTYERSLADSVAIADVIEMAIGLVKADNVAISDSIADVVEFYLSIADTVTIADALIKAVGLGKADSIAISDSLVKGIGIAKTDTIAIADAISKKFGLPFDDSITIADALIKGMGLRKADTVTITDVLSKSMGLVKRETVTIADVIKKAFSIVKSDVVTITDSMFGILRLRTYARQQISRIPIKRLNISRMPLYRWIIRRFP